MFQLLQDVTVVEPLTVNAGELIPPPAKWEPPPVRGVISEPRFVPPVVRVGAGTAAAVRKAVSPVVWAHVRPCLTAAGAITGSLGQDVAKQSVMTPSMAHVPAAPGICSVPCVRPLCSESPCLQLPAAADS